MKSFSYMRARDVTEATRAAQRPGSKVIAGGTNLLDLAKLSIERPSALIDVNRIPGLKDIRRLPDGGVRIGALVTNADLAAHPLIREHYPLLSRALLAGASGQIRNMATTVGNLLQRTRCVQFYDTSDRCNKRAPGSGCGALDGANRMNAIVGGSASCIAVHPSDMAVAMRILDAVVETTDAYGAHRRIPIDDFYVLPDAAPQHETVLTPGEMITGVSLPAPPQGMQSYRKVRDRASYAFALVSVGAIAAVEEGHFTRVRFAFGGIAPKPWRIEAAEAALRGKPRNAQAISTACDIALAGAAGHGDNDFKIALAHRTLIAVLGA